MAEIGSLEVSLSLNASNFNGTISQVNQNMKAMGGELQALKAKGSDYENSVEGLRQKQDILQRSFDASAIKLQEQRKRYDELVASGKATDAQLARAATAVNKAQTEYNKLETQLSQVTNELEQQSNKWVQAQKKLNDFGTKLDDVGGKLKDVGGKMTASITAPIVALGGAALFAASQFDSSQSQIQASLGLTAQEAEKLQNSATKVWKDGFGESLEDVTRSLTQVKQNMKLVSDGAELEKVTRDAIALGKTLEADVNEVTRAGNNLMVNFGITSEKAFDLMAKGGQNGLNFSQEMFDNLAEYSGLFSDMGYSADEYFQLLVNGSKEGVYNLDYINDVMKEAQIRFKDGSKTTSDAMTQLSSSTQKVWESFLDGNSTVKDVSNAVLGELKGMDDQVLANQIGVGLYGTKWEDLESQAMYALTTVGDEMTNVSGTMNKVAESQDKTFGQRWNETLRTAQDSLLPLGETVLELADRWLPKISNGIETVSDWFSDLSPKAQNVTLAIGGIAAVAGPVIAGFGMISSGISSIVAVATPVISAIGGISLGTGTLGGVLAAAAGPIGWTALGIAAIGTAAVVVGKEMSESSIEVESWKDKVSEGTAEAVGSFMELSDQATLSLNQLSWSGATVTQEMATNLISIYDDMGNQVIDAMKEDHEAQLQLMTDHFTQSSALTEQEEAEILANMETKQAAREVAISDGQARIAEILNKAKEEKRAITESEQQEINFIQEKMTENAVEYLTENEREQKVILENLKNEASKITADQAAEVVRNSLKQKEDVVKEAQDQYDKVVAEIIKQRDEMGAISEDQAKKLIDEAKRQRDETVSNAEDMHTKVIEEAQKQADEHVEKVNWETGEVLSKWEVFKNDASKKYDEIKSNTSKKWDEVREDTAAKWEEIKAWPGKKINEMKIEIATKMGEVATTIWGKIEEIKGFFTNLKLKLPEIELPKLPTIELETKSKTVLGKKITYPSGFDIIWHADGGLMVGPTIFGTNGNSLLGGGEAGPEAILPLNDRVLGKIGVAIAETINLEKLNSDVVIYTADSGVREMERTNGGDTFHITIDAKNVKEFNDMINMMKGLKQAYNSN